jgi:glycosyltransferase involved in cell wall biosynthesis
MTWKAFGIDMNRAQVSVIIPCFNGEAFLKEALESVLRQGDLIGEVIIVDDGSSNPVSNPSQFKNDVLKIIRQENKGQGSALNRGIAESSLPFIAIIDHDDIWQEDKTRRQLKLIQEHDADAVIGEVVNFRSLQGEVIESRNLGTARVFGACLFRRQVFEEIAVITEDRRIHEVIDWWSRAKGQLKTVEDREVALFRRIHGGNQTLNKRYIDRSDLIVRVRQNLDRHHRN